MKIISKIFLGISLFYTIICSKVFGISIDDKIIVALYGIPEPSLGEKIAENVPIFITVILFIIGLFVFINRNISIKIKKIIIFLFLIITTALVVFNLIK